MKPVIRLGLIASAIALTLMAGVMIWAYQTLPEGRIPLHWNIHNEVDRWGTRTEALWSLAIMPIVTLFVCALLAVVPSIDPRKANLEKSAKVYGIAWISTLVLLVGVHAGVAYMTISGVTGEALGKETVVPFVRLVIAATGILFVVIGNYLPKTRPNWFLGIRTPWTLSSNDTWEKTHRVGGRLFMLMGLATILAAFIFNGLTLALLPAALSVGTALVCVVYSYIVWRNAPDKHTDPDLIV